MRHMRPGLVLALVAGCAPRPLTPMDWRSQPPAAPCEVIQTSPDENGTDHRVARYDASGRLLYAETRLTEGGRGFEYLIWDADRIARIDTFYEQDAIRGKCEVIGGCDEPAYRTVERTDFRYDGAGPLRHMASTKREYALKRGGWFQVSDKDDERGYRYERGKLVAIEHEGEDERFDYEHGRPVRRRFRGGTLQFEWHGNRLLVYRTSQNTESFEYDDGGRLVGVVLAKPDATVQSLSEWTYNAAGDVLSMTTRTGAEVRTQSFDYDDQGRLIRRSQDGRSAHTYAYGAACSARLNAVRAPRAEGYAGLDVCITSPGYSFATCLYELR